MVFTTNGFRYEIREVPDVSSAIVDIRGSKMGFRGELSGACLHDKGLILIDANQSEAERGRTLLHEALHAIIPSMDERRVRRIEKDLYRLVRRCGYRYPDLG